jgi:hypothetical protein
MAVKVESFKGRFVFGGVAKVSGLAYPLAWMTPNWDGRSPSNFAYARSKCQKHLTEGAIALSEVTVLSPVGQVGSVLQDR